MKKLTQTKDYLLFIDEKSEIKEGDKWIYDKYSPSIIPLLGNTNIVKEGISKGWFNKIIAYRKLNEEAKELDLPLLPNPFKEEVNIEKLAISSFGYKPTKVDNSIILSLSKGYIRGFQDGYKAATKQFSLEDMKKAIEMAREEYYNEGGYQGLEYEPEQIIQSLSTQQLPKEFVILDMEYLSADGTWKNVRLPLLEDFAKTAVLRYKTITNSEGKEELVGTYKY